MSRSDNARSSVFTATRCGRKLYQRGVELTEAYERIEELAELDELTGSFNRRCIMRMLDDEIVRSDRSKPPCSIALIDLDWFKRINDAYGHPTGDEVLRTFAITIFANIRNMDRFGRYGGEEFLLVLPGTPDDEAARMLDRLRAIIADLDWSAFSPGMQVTMSAGVAMLRPDESAGLHFWPAPTARFMQPRQEDATVSPEPELQTTTILRGRRIVTAFQARTLQERVHEFEICFPSESLLDELQSTLAHGTVARRGRDPAPRD